MASCRWDPGSRLASPTSILKVNLPRVKAAGHCDVFVQPWWLRDALSFSLSLKAATDEFESFVLQRKTSPNSGIELGNFW
jgi:hypothetical protein